MLCSGLEGVFSLGGDLARFINLIEQKNRDALHRYAKGLYRRAVSVGYQLRIAFHHHLLVQGEALGGGFEGSAFSQRADS